MRLNQLSTGQKAIVVKILGHGAFRKRLIEMGFVKGREVTVLLHAPLHDPIKYQIMDYEVSLRAAEAHLIEVVPAGDKSACEIKLHDKTITDCEDFLTNPSKHTNNDFNTKCRTINLALIGNPNCGKTSLFNFTSGAHEHVGNYSGVTVDAKKGHFEYKEYCFNIVDLPGTYSLDSYTPEELYVRRYLKEETPDVIVNVVVASNLERNLYLTTELIDMDRKMVIALNMYDELQQNGDKIDYDLLGQMIGVPIVPTVSRNGEGIHNLLDTIIEVYEDRHQSVRHIHVNLGPEIEHGVTIIKDLLKQDGYVGRHFSPRYLSIKLLQHDKEAEQLISGSPDANHIMKLRDREVKRIESKTEEDITSAIAGEKYGFISGALAETLDKSERQASDNTRIIDAFVTNKLFGFPIFILIMMAMFWATFELGSYPMHWIETAIEWICNLFRNFMPQGVLKDLVTDGIIGGVGGVIVFLPNILILYFCISFMEDSGYMARAAFIMDKLMHRIGLHGKSFIPLVMGFGCNVPAILSSRSIESKSSRIITVLINPFMSCSARLPIYVLLVGTFFPTHATLVFTGLYALGIVVAMVTARLLRRFYFKADETPFVMELPPYRLPSLHSSLSHMWSKGRQYLKKMGGVILVASIIVWALNYFPIHNADESLSYPTIDDSRIDWHHDSYLAIAGKSIDPVMSPLGFSWRATVAALAGVPAKEIVVSTLGVLYTGDEETDNAALSTRLTAPNPITGKPDFDTATALSFMVFILLYCPCIATITAIVKETGNWRYGAFSVIYNTAMAWLLAWVTFLIAS